MPQAALNHTENHAKIILVNRKFCFEQMKSTEETAVFDRMTDDTIAKTKKGMNCFPLDVYNSMIEYSLNHGKFRNAMLMICMANWGMRFSDVVRVRFGHLFDNNGQIRESFSLPNGEKKTKKEVIYYNNEATKAIISLYLNQPENSNKSRLDFLFVSESQGKNKPVASVQELEAADLYDPHIENLEKKINEVIGKIDGLTDKYVLKKFSDKEYKTKDKQYRQEKSDCEKQLRELLVCKNKYVSPTPNADKIFIQKPISHTAGENIIKDTLRKIGIIPKNRKDKSKEQTTNDKYNTHSLRKTFSYWFIEIGEELKNREDLSFDATILDLLKEKLKHSSRSVTAHYTDAQQRAFKLICQNLNIGLEAVENFIYGG